jgi:hypothetical protein
MSPAECAAFLQRLFQKIRKLRDEFNKYDPMEDAKGGFPMAFGSRRTKRYGHYTEITELQRGIKDDIDTYYRECGTPPDPATRNELRCGQTLANEPVPRFLPDLDDELKGLFLLMLLMLKAAATGFAIAA